MFLVYIFLKLKSVQNEIRDIAKLTDLEFTLKRLLIIYVKSDLYRNIDEPAEYKIWQNWQSRAPYKKVKFMIFRDPPL